MRVVSCTCLYILPAEEQACDHMGQDQGRWTTDTAACSVRLPGSQDGQEESSTGIFLPLAVGAFRNPFTLRSSCLQEHCSCSLDSCFAPGSPAVPSLVDSSGWLQALVCSSVPQFLHIHIMGQHQCPVSELWKVKPLLTAGSGNDSSRMRAPVRPGPSLASS